MGKNGLDWLRYLAGNFQTATKIDFIFLAYVLCINYFMKNPQTTFVPTFLTQVIASINAVHGLSLIAEEETDPNFPFFLCHQVRIFFTVAIK